MEKDVEVDGLVVLKMNDFVEVNGKRMVATIAEAVLRITFGTVV